MKTSQKESDRQTDRYWDKACFGFSSVWRVNICKKYTILHNVQTKLKFYFKGYLRGYLVYSRKGLSCILIDGRLYF